MLDTRGKPRAWIDIHANTHIFIHIYKPYKGKSETKELTAGGNITLQLDIIYGPFYNSHIN